MLQFVLLAGLMLAFALAVVLPPLLRGGARSADPAAETKRKLKALAQARADGILDEAEYASKRAALAEALIGDLDAKPTNATRSIYAAIAIALLLPAAGIGLYRMLGDTRALDPAALQAGATTPADHGQDMQQAIDKLADKLKQSPDDAQGWALLGRAYQATERFSDARDALKHAHELAPADSDITVAYAEALALASDTRSIEGEPRALLEKGLAADPTNQRGLWLLGIADYQLKKFDAAIATWQHLITLLPKGSDVQRSVEHQIAQAQAERDGRAPPESPSEPGDDAASSVEHVAEAPSATDPHLTVKVALDAKLKAKAGVGDTVFVYAKAASGPPMPLAVQRLTVAQLPATVTLSDGMGMVPTLKLSQFPQVVIGARISKTGNAIAQSGDLQTLSKPMDVGTRVPVELTIDQVVP